MIILCLSSGIRIPDFVMKSVSGLSRALYILWRQHISNDEKSMTLRVGRKRIQTKATSRVNLSFWDILLAGNISSGNGLIALFSHNDTAPFAWHLGTRNNDVEVVKEDESSEQ
jgi:hypothetical protein